MEEEALSVALGAFIEMVKANAMHIRKKAEFSLQEMASGTRDVATPI
jgi:hypothetical protein